LAMASASLGGAASTTTVTLSLPSLIEQLKDIVSEDRKEPLDALLRQAKESTHEQVHIKKQMIALATPDELRAAVNAIMAAAEASASSQQSETPAAAAAPPAPAEQAGSSNSLSQQMPDPTSELEQLETMFDDTTKEHFRTTLIHAFHCRTPSCPVPDCEAMSAKLERLHQHVSSCSTPGCVLCRMWTYLKYYRDSLEPGALNAGTYSALYVEPLLQSSQLLPCWRDGKISWVPPREALAQLQLLNQAGAGVGADIAAQGRLSEPPLAVVQDGSGGVWDAEARASGMQPVRDADASRPTKRPRRGRAAQAAQTSIGGAGTEAPACAGASAACHYGLGGPACSACGGSGADGVNMACGGAWLQQHNSSLAPTSSYAGIQGVLSTPLTWPPEHVAHASAAAAQSVGCSMGLPAMQGAPMHAPGMEEPNDAGEPNDDAEEKATPVTRSGSTLSSFGISRDISLSCLPIPGLPMSHSGLSGSNLNLADLIVNNSLSDLGLSLCKSRSELKSRNISNVSELSLGDIFEGNNPGLHEILQDF